MHGNLNTYIRHKFHSKKDHPEMFTNSQIYKPKHIIFNISFFSTCNEAIHYALFRKLFSNSNNNIWYFSNLFSLALNQSVHGWHLEFPLSKLPLNWLYDSKLDMYQSHIIFKDRKKCHSNILPIIHDNKFLPYQPVFLYTKPINNSIKSIALFCQ